MKKPLPVSALLSRRRFVGQLTAGAAALTFSLRARAQTPEKKLGVAIVGLGNYATNQIAPALQLTQRCRLTGVVTGSPAKGRQWASQRGFSEQNIYSYETMARIADNPEIDIVYVITPNALHAEGVIAAAKAGKHVISEKPFTTSVADAEQAIAACREAGVMLSLGYRLHFDPFHRELKRIARERDFGELTTMTGSNGFRMAKKVWRAERHLAGGGPLMDMGIYCVQAACMAADGATPVAVTAREHPKTRPEIFEDVEEGLDWTMEFASGARAELSTSYSANTGRFRAEGAKGWVSLEPAFGYSGLKGETSRGPMNAFGVRSQQALQLDDFARCIREKSPTIVPGEMGLRDMKIITAIYASAAAGGKRTLVKT